MKTLMICAMAWLPAGVALADEAERREVGAHEHGHSVLNIAIEGDRIEMELMAPGIDIVGFEHAAETDEHKAAVTEAEAILSDPLALFVLPDDAGCATETAAVELQAEQEGEHGRSSMLKRSTPSRRARRRTPSSTPNMRSPATCRTISARSSSSSSSHFPGAEEIEVTVITEDGQTRYEVERAAPRIDLKGLI